MSDANPQTPPNFVPPPNYSPMAGPPLPQTRISGLAIAALVLSIIPLTFPIGIILAIIALVTIPRNPHRSGTGLAIAGLAVGVAMVLLVPLMIAITLPAVARSREIALRVQCASTLAGMGKSLRVYQVQNNDSYPSVERGRRIDGTPTDVTAAIDTQASMWLLVRTRTAAPQAMICPADGWAVPAPQPDDADPPFHDVTLDGKRLRTWSYSYQIPQGTDFEQPGASRFAVMADRAPAYDELALLPTEVGQSVGSAAHYLKHLPRKQQVRFNSPNHGGDGQNVLFADGHVTWCDHPFAGIEGDNIYTWATGEPYEQSRIIGHKPGSSHSVSARPASDRDNVLCNILYGVPVQP